MQKKMASKISAGVLSAVLVLQGMFPTVAVMADEISETGSSETVIEETIAETSESEEAKVSETSETTAETEPSETEETVPTEPSETSETTVAETSAEQTVPSETAETTATSETTEAKSSVNIVDADITDIGAIFTLEIDEPVTIFVELNFGMLPGYGWFRDAKVTIRMRTNVNQTFLEIFCEWFAGVRR